MGNLVKLTQVKLIGKTLLLCVFLLLVHGYSVAGMHQLLSDTSDDHSRVKQQNIWIFMMAGQSNMAGRGTIEPQDTVINERILTIDSENDWIIAREPLHFYEPTLKGLDCGMTFAMELLKHIPDSVTIIMVPCAVGGSSVSQWLNGEQHRGVNLLSNFREKVQLAQNKGIIKGILWHQGESDANKSGIPVYKNALLQLFGLFREYIGNDKVPIIMGELGRFAIPEEKAERFDAVNKIIRNIAAEHDHIYYVPSYGLDHNGDNLHFNSAAQRELGRRYAVKFLEILSDR